MATNEVQLDNGTFRVTRWTIEPADSIPMHRHDHEYVVVPLVDGEMYVVNSDGTEIRAELSIGQSYTRPAGAEHSVHNRGTETISFIEVEKL